MTRTEAIRALHLRPGDANTVLTSDVCTALWGFEAFLRICDLSPARLVSFLDAARMHYRLDSATHDALCAKVADLTHNRDADPDAWTGAVERNEATIGYDLAMQLRSAGVEVSL